MPGKESDSGEQEAPYSIVRGLLVAALVALLIVAGADLSVGAALASRERPSAYEQPRNPHFRFDWERYTEPRARASNEIRVAVVGNSMGFMRESPDGRQIYTAVLRDLLAARHPDRPVHVLNFSVPGTAGHEMAVLAARALDHDPDLLVVMTYSDDFAKTKLEFRLDWMGSDAPTLVYASHIRERLSPWFKRRFGAYDPKGWALANSSLLAANRLLLPGQEEFATWDVTRAEDAAMQDGMRTAPRRSRATDRLLAEFPAIVDRAGTRTQLLFVEMPVYARAWRVDARAYLSSFGQQVRDAIGDAPATTVLSALDLLPRESHVTPTHLHPGGHVALAEWLLPHVEPRLR